MSVALRDNERDAWRRLIRVMGHGINNSLAPIQSIAASLRASVGRRQDDPEWEQDLADGLDVVGRRAEALGRFMASYAKLARLPPPRLATVDVGALVTKIAAFERRITVEVLEGPPATVEGDADQLEQVLINLVKNATEAAEAEGGGVRMRWALAGAAVEIEVEDDGTGVDDTANLFVRSSPPSREARDRAPLVAPDRRGPRRPALARLARRPARRRRPRPPAPREDRRRAQLASFFLAGVITHAIPPMTQSAKTIGFLGAGNMASALVKGLLHAGVFGPQAIMVSDVKSDRLAHLMETHGVRTTTDNHELVRSVDVLVLAVKPQVLDRVLDAIATDVREDTLIVSVAAGVPLEALEGRLPPFARVVRTMPNTPATALAGATAISAGARATEADIQVARSIFEAIGRVVVLDEPLLDAVTGLSGSGPAYVMLIIEALADGGEDGAPPRHGAPRPRRPCTAPPSCCSRPASTPAGSRTWSRAPGAPPSRGSTRSSPARSARR